MRNVISNQREERDKLLANPYLERKTKYDTEVLLHDKMIKLITGPRRAGKSVYALLMLRGKQFAYLNFDDQQLLNKWDEDLVMLLLDEVYPNYEYLLLDEVQNLDNWDLWVSKLYRRGLNLIITGSNARMLSQEMATVLTGRYVQIEMLPFGLDEFMQWHNIDLQKVTENKNAEMSVLKNDYLRLGGYPETLSSRSMTQTYLNTLFDSIIFKDVARRHKIRNTIDLQNLALYLLSNFCNLFTANDIAVELSFKSVATTQKFIEYLHEPYLFYYLQRYDNKLKLMKKAARKVYVVDNGFVAASAFNLSSNFGRLLENQVFIELLRRGYDVEKTLFYYRSRNDKETDFVIRQGTVVQQLMQVCYDFSSEKTIRREIDSLIECGEELHCDNLTIITFDHEEVVTKNGHTIQVIPVAKM